MDFWVYPPVRMFAMDVNKHRLLDRGGEQLCFTNVTSSC